MKSFIIVLLIGLLCCAGSADAAVHFTNNMPQEQTDTVYYIPGVMKETARLYKDKDNAASVLLYIPADSSVMILDTAGDYFLVHYGDLDGFVRQERVKQHEEILWELTTPPEEMEHPSPKNRHDLLIAKYGRENGKKIYEHFIWKGMTSEMVLDSWGKPRVINHYEQARGYREEWIYPKHILIFSNGILTGWVKR